MPDGFWQHVVDSSMALPADRPLGDLTVELVTMLGSADPVERDDIAYAVLATWVSEGVYDDLLATVGDSLARGLRTGLGCTGDDTVFRRSFSALVLAACVARDNVAVLLPVDTVLGWADRALHWFVAEEDLRGQVPQKGWAHAIAHGADLLATLAQSRHLSQPHLEVLLDVVAERVLSTSSRVLVDGEDDRLAVAVLSIVQRNLVPPDRLDAWVDRLGAGLVRHQQPSAASAAAADWPSAAARNTSAFLRALHVHLAVGVRPTSATIAFTEPPLCRGDLLLALLRVIPGFTPWLYSSGAPTDTSPSWSTQ